MISLNERVAKTVLRGGQKPPSYLSFCVFFIGQGNFIFTRKREFFVLPTMQLNN